MKSTNRSISRLTGLLVILVITMASKVLLRGQEGQAGRTNVVASDRIHHHKGVAWDWTHHHVVFSRPGSRDDAMRQGTYERWLRIVNDPRYIMQQQERSAKTAGDALDAAPRAVSAAEPARLELGAGRVGTQFDADVQTQDAASEMTLEERNAQAALRGLPFGLMKAILPPSGEPAGAALVSGSTPEGPEATTKKKNRLKKDWSETLGPSGTVGAAGGTTGLGEFPATFTTGTSCTDFAIFNNGLAGSSSQANIIAYDNLYSSCNGGTPTTYWAYNTGTLGGVSAAIANSVVLSLDGTQVAFVQFVPYATAASGTLTANVGTVPTAGSTVTIGGTTYTWETTASITTVNQMSTSGITLETEISQTLYAALTGSRANCPSSNTTCISASQTANSLVSATVSGEIVTVSATCGGGAGTCGNTVAFTQSSTATGMNISPTGGELTGGSGTAGVGGAQLVVLKWAAGGTLTSPTTLTSNSSYPSCTAPCMISVPFSGTPTDTYSAPFIAYGLSGNPSTIYVGDDVGVLHQFKNIFSTGTPSEVTTGGWPVTVNANASLGSPIYDAGSLNVFVGDYAPFTSLQSCQLFTTPNTCGYLYSVNSSGTVVKSAQLDYNVGILDSPVVDSNAGKVYAFVGDDGSTNCTTSAFGPGPCAGVFQFTTGFTGGATGTEAAVGAGYEFMMSGTFDNAYYSSSNSTGHLYVVGNTGPANNTLYQIPINTNVMSTSANVGPAVATNYTNGYYSAGLQVSEFYNTSAGNHDYLFLSVLGFGQDNANIACPSQSVSMGCIIGFDVTSGTISNSTAATGVLPESGGTSGIVVDNGKSGASNIYFSTLLNQSCTTSGGTNGCATQTSQSAP
jgi:hypothetical protein